MVIDKTTGRGCALSIASKIVTKELIAEGIIGKPICRRLRKNSKKSYELLRVVKFKNEEHVYVTSQKDNELTEESLWYPSFITTKIWQQTVSRFLDFKRLDQSVEKYLLPEMEEYLQSIPEAELVSITREFLIENGVINTPICQHTGKTYFFNKDEIYSIDKKSEMFPYESQMKFNIFKIRGEGCFNMNV